MSWLHQPGGFQPIQVIYLQKTDFDVHNFEKYNPNSSLASKSYAFFQLIFVSLISTVFIELGELNLPQGIVVAIAIGFNRILCFFVVGLARRLCWQTLSE